MSLRRFAPSAPIRVHLGLAASLWTAVGCGLLAYGVVTAIHLGSPLHATAVIAVALLVGAAKARWVLARTARRIAGRIVERGDGRCLGGFLSPTSWLLVVAMVLGGRLVRSSHWLSRGVVALLYAAVGAALLIGSWWLWQAWRTARPGVSGTAGGPAAPPGSQGVRRTL